MTAILDGRTYDIRDRTYTPPSRRQFRCFLAVIRESEDDFSVIVLNLPGAVGCGGTEDAAVDNACDAVRELVDQYEQDGENIPWESNFEVPDGVKLRKVLVDAK